MRTFIVSPKLQDVVNAVFPNAKVKFDKELSMYDEFVPLLDTVKKTSVRYGKDAIRMPSSSELPLYETRRDDKAYKKPIGIIELVTVDVKKLGELTDADGIADGFGDRNELYSVIKDIYTPIYGATSDDDFISVYHFGKWRK